MRRVSCCSEVIAQPYGAVGINSPASSRDVAPSMRKEQPTLHDGLANNLLPNLSIRVNLRPVVIHERREVSLLLHPLGLVVHDDPALRFQNYQVDDAAKHGWQPTRGFGCRQWSCNRNFGQKPLSTL